MPDAPPDPTPEAAAAVHCWNWCGGWAPERWPLYFALHGPADVDMIATLMAVIRDEINRPDTH